MREVDEAKHAVHHRVPERDQCVDGSERQAVNELLEEGVQLVRIDRRLVDELHLALDERDFLDDGRLVDVPLRVDFEASGHAGDIAVRQYDIVVIALVAVLYASLYLWLARTRSGLAIQALTDNAALAGLIGVDVNPDAIMVAQDRLSFEYNTLDRPRRVETRTFVGDARNLDLIGDEAVDLIATHPPYAGIISYSGKRILDDLSRLKLPAYIDAMRKVAAESYRVLKNNRYCGVLIGDTRKGRHYIPISLGVLQAFLSVGFILKEDIIKLQHKTMTTRQRWRGHSYDFYKIAHEHLYVFRKPALDEKTAPLKYSKKWW